MPDVTVNGVVNPMRFPEEMPVNDIRTFLQGRFPGPQNNTNVNQLESQDTEQPLTREGESYMDGVGRRFMQMAEPAATMVSGALAEPVSGLMSLPALIYGDGVNDAVKAQKSIQEWMTYVPKTEGGQEGMKAVTDVLKPVADAFEWTSRGAGDYVYEKTGSEELAAIAYSMPTAALELLGMKGVRNASKAGKLGKQYDFTGIATTNKQAGAVSGIKPMADYPIVDPKTLIGKTIKPTLADLTDTGRVFRGIDSSKTRPVALPGGPGFALDPDNQAHDIVWAVNDKGGLAKLQKGDIIAVEAMKPNTHRSNATVTEAYLETLEAYVSDGRIDDANVQKLDAMISSNPMFEGFPGLENIKESHDWLVDLTFDKRAKFTDIMHSKAASKLGTPNFQKILDSTIDPKYAGYNLGDNMLLLEVGKDGDAIVELGTNGTKKHNSYKYGVKGKILGRLPRPTSKETLFPDFHAQRRLDNTDPGKDYRSFQLGLPQQLITPEIAASIGDKPFSAISSPRQAKLTQNFINNKWNDTASSVKQGGVSTQKFIDEIDRSDASATLSKYDPKELGREVRQGQTKLYQLKDSDIYFGIKKDYNYNDEYGIDLEAAGLGPNEKAVIGVVNNEKGAKGVAGTSVMLKAIQEGATVLDAFSVKSKRFPDGFLPALYGEYGFKEAAKVPFDPQYYSKIELNDLKRVWKQGGWDESQGYPDISIMKWNGDDNARAGIQKQWLDAIKQGDESGFIGRAMESDVLSTREAIRESRSAAGGKVQGPGNSRNDTGSTRNSNRASPTGKFADVVREVDQLTPGELANLGIPKS